MSLSATLNEKIENGVYLQMTLFVSHPTMHSSLSLRILTLISFQFYLIYAPLLNVNIIHTSCCYIFSILLLCISSYMLNPLSFSYWNEKTKWNVINPTQQARIEWTQCTASNLIWPKGTKLNWMKISTIFSSA